MFVFPPLVFAYYAIWYIVIIIIAARIPKVNTPNKIFMPVRQSCFKRQYQKGFPAREALILYCFIAPKGLLSLLCNNQRAAAGNGGNGIGDYGEVSGGLNLIHYFKAVENIGKGGSLAEVFTNVYFHGF